MGKGDRVLVIDGLLETQEVLKAVLGPRGTQVDRVRGTDVDTKRLQPDVVVIHEDQACDRPSAPADWQSVPQVRIGETDPAQDAAVANGQRYLQHPFHYPELVQAIEQLLHRGGLERPRSQQ